MDKNFSGQPGDAEMAKVLLEPKFSHIWGITVLTIVCFLAVVLSVSDTFGNASMIIAELTIIVPALVYLHTTGFPVRASLRLHPVGWPVVGLSILLGLTLSFVASGVDTLSESLLPMPDDLRSSLEQLLIMDSMSDVILILSGLVFGAAVCEDLFFRGFLQTALERIRGPWSAVIASSLVFGIVHFNPWWFVSILFAGVILGITAFVSGSVYPGIIAHGVNNGLSLLIANAARWEEYRWISGLETLPVPLTVVSTVILTFCIICLQRYKPHTSDT